MFSKNHFNIFFAILIFLFPIIIQTQENENEEKVPEFQETITVTAPRMELPKKEVAGAITVVDEDVLKNMPKSICADEALNLVPGVTVDNQANGKRMHLSIRGIGILTERGIRGIMVLLDGLPLNDPSGFAPDLYDVNWESIERIEVLRGPLAMLYGGGSSGGVLNIITKDGSTEKTEGGVNGWKGSNDFWKTSAWVGGTDGNLNYRVSLSRDMGDGWRVHTAFHGDNLYAKLKWEPLDVFQLTYIASYTGFFSQNPEGLNKEQLEEDPTQPNPDAVSKNEFQKTNRVTNGFSGNWKLSSNQNLNFMFLYRNWSWKESVPSSVQHRKYEQPEGYLKYDLTSKFGSLKNYFSIGIDLNRQNIKDFRHPNLGFALEGPEYVSNQDISQHSIGLFAMDRLEITPQWALFFGLRRDKIKNELEDHLKANGLDLSGEANFEKTTGRVGITWNPSPNIGFYADWAEGFLPPATEELYANPNALGGFNKELVPSTSKGEEVGVRGIIANSFLYDIAFFYMKTKDDFERYRVPERPLETFYRNGGNSRRAGAEVSLAWMPIDILAFRLAYTYNDFEYTEYDSITYNGDMSGNTVPNSPKHQGYFDLEYSPVKNLKLGASVEHRSKWYVDPTNIPYCDGYTLLNARIAYLLLSKDKYKIDIALYGQNLTDKIYVGFSEPDPDGNSYQPAPGREFFASMRIQF